MSWRAQLSRHVRELRFLVSPTAPSSAAVRNYIQTHYDELKMLNPSTPFLVRENFPGKDPYIVATYDWGKNVVKKIGGLNEEQIDATLKDLVDLGKTLPKYHDPPSFVPDPIVNSLPRPEFY